MTEVQRRLHHHHPCRCFKFPHHKENIFLIEKSLAHQSAKFVTCI